MITTNDPLLGQAGPGATIKTSVSFYHLDPRKGDFRLLRACLVYLACSTVMTNV